MAGSRCVERTVRGKNKGIGRFFMERDTVPDWLDAEEYPFRPHWFTTPAGEMHYVDEGSGTPVVFVHGNPSWSFEFRRPVLSLSQGCRCIAPDHIGFGLSEKPADWSYLPEGHAGNLESLLESLQLEKITLVVADWGGPIGLSYAIAHPEKVTGLVITNTWMWPVNRDWYYIAFSSFMGGPVGRGLIRKHNFFAKAVVRAAFGDRKKLTPEIHRHYLGPLSEPAQRKGCWTFPGQIIGSSDWLGHLWSERDRLLGKDVVLAWGMKDIAFRKKELNRWKVSFPEARVVMFEDAGHYLAEEKAAELTAEIERLVRGG
jgi:haloalkane dehalogenase